MTTYNSRIYKIDEIDFEKNPRDTFYCNMHNRNQEITFADYINQNYK